MTNSHKLPLTLENASKDPLHLLKPSNIFQSSTENTLSPLADTDCDSFTESLYDNIEDFLDLEGLVLDGPPVILSNNSLKPSFNSREVESLPGESTDENKLALGEEKLDLKTLLRLSGKGQASRSRFSIDDLDDLEE